MSGNHVHGQGTGTVLQAHTITGGVHLHPAPDPPPEPRQLPAPRLFVDRLTARAWLDHAWTARHGPLWVGVEGDSGIGKTALITDWGHHHQDRWPDGALYADLARTSVDTTLRGWLTALDHTHLPASPDQLQALWRTITAHRRLLVVIENATADTALELFPSGAGCAGIATAHQGLADLVAAGARYVRLPALPDHAVSELITGLIDHPVPEPLLRDAVTSTGGVPLAATLTAAVLARDLATTLTETEQENTVSDRVNELISEFPQSTIDLVAMIAAHPGPWVSADLIAHLVGTTAGQAHHALRDLAEATLLTDIGQGRYTVHDRVRAPLEDRLTPAAHEQLLHGLAAFYRLRTAAVEEILNPWRWRADTEGRELARAAQPHGPWFASRDHALAWIDAELDNLVAVTNLLHVHGRCEAWMICDQVGTYMVLRKPAVAEDLYRWGLVSAHATGDGRAVGLMLQRLSTTLPQDGHEALDLNTRAREAYEEAGYVQGVASAYESIGSLLGRLGRLEDAEQAQNTSLRLHHEVGNSRGAAFQHRRLGEIYIQQGRTTEAQEAFNSSYRTLLELDPPDLYQATRSAQGMIALLLDQGEAAQLPVVEMLALQGLAATRISGSRVQEATLYLDLAKIARARGEDAEELAHLQRVGPLVEADHPVAEQATQRLAELGGPTSRTAPTGEPKVV